MYTMGPFDVIEDATHDLKDGNNYGIFTNAASVVVNDPTEGESNLLVDVSSYASRSTALKKDRVYSLIGRMIKNTKTGTYTVFYEQCMNLDIGDSSNYLSDAGSLLLNKIGVLGFGTIVKLDRFKTQGKNKALQTDLHVTLQHTDYDNLSRDSILFECVYIVPGNKLLSKTHPLFELGAEVLMVGHINGFQEKVTTWEVEVLMFAIGSGPVNGAMLAPSLIPGSSVGGRRNVKRVTASQTTPTPARQSTSKLPDSSPSVFPIPSSSNSQRAPTPERYEESEEEGEVSARNRGQDADDNHFENTFPNQKNKGKRPAPSSNTPNTVATQPRVIPANPAANPTNRLADAQKKFKPNY
ncbi:hypothetical protein MJO28_001235 [Puccinia striiformis f. sp. tritici]|uniref:Uncharacterized protein n=1 Tax=Puccinia striiformis f. sp. tritici TaxID=168172 RepID=A0ACC0F143_9BASI|nr:hypothetical protein MJO28_001235 [Puccinia striiformis f. sp. tritici]